jgi:hypothetical protein
VIADQETRHGIAAQNAHFSRLVLPALLHESVADTFGDVPRATFLRVELTAAAFTAVSNQSVGGLPLEDYPLNLDRLAILTRGVVTSANSLALGGLTLSSRGPVEDFRVGWAPDGPTATSLAPWLDPRAMSTQMTLVVHLESRGAGSLDLQFDSLRPVTAPDPFPRQDGNVGVLVRTFVRPSL